MVGLRERSKSKRRQRVLEVAEQLFRTTGYEAVRIEEIAGQAEVSIGTIYSYFGSKGGIMAALMQPVIDRMQEKAEAIIANPPKHAVDATAAMYEAYRFGDDWKDHNLLDAFAPSSPGDHELGAVATLFDQFISEQLVRLFKKLAVQDCLNPNLDADDLTYIVYRLLTSHFQDYVTGRVGTYEETLVNLHRRLRLLFQPWN